MRISHNLPVVYCVKFEFLNRREFTFFIYYSKGDLLFTPNHYFEYQGELGILGCLVLNLLLESNFTLDVYSLFLLEQKVQPEGRCGWKPLTRRVTFSNVTAPVKKSSPSICKRTISSPEGNGIAQMLAHKRQEKLDSLASWLDNLLFPVVICSLL